MSRSMSRSMRPRLSTSRSVSVSASKDSSTFGLPRNSGRARNQRLSGCGRSSSGLGVRSVTDCADGELKERLQSRE
jgi:hypothetical protein